MPVGPVRSPLSRQGTAREMSFKAALLSGAFFHLALASAAFAATDCPPLGAMPNYAAAAEAEVRPYDVTEFSVRKADEIESVEVKGRTCRQSYAAKDATTASDLEIQSNYRERLQKLGAQILYRDERNTVAKLVKGSEETWLKVYSQETDIDVVTVVRQPLKLTLAPPSGPDYRLLGRMPNYVAKMPEKKNLDEFGFAVRGEEEVTEIPAQGAKYVVVYSLKPGAEAASDAEIQENYRAALGLLGAALLYTDPRTTVARLEQNGQTIWVRVFSQEGEIEVRAIEEKPFAAPVLQAAALKSALEKEGRVALYVGFDGAKAALKPEAAKTVAEIVKLLKENPTLKLSIEGHTDDVGPRPGNEKLSRERAAAVLDAIAAGGIARARLSSVGHGPAKPLADNGTSEGRARNRRVELVKG
jgi:outer membrane protein OmpA-like peptidoglycan-associated protein